MSTDTANTSGQQEPSGPKGDTPATAGTGETKVHSSTPENREGHINPSAPNDSITPPGGGPAKNP